MSDSNDKIAEELKILNQRLIDSTYLEDKIEAIENIHQHVKNDCNLVGIHCLSSVIKSLQQFVHKYHFKILTKIFNSLNGKEFVEIFLKNEEYLKIIINAKNRRGTDLFILLCHFDHRKICDSFHNEQSRKYFTKLHEHHLNLLLFLLEGHKLKNEFIREGLLEKIFSFLREKRAVKKCFILVELILKDSHFCQNYFNEKCLDELIEFRNLNIFHFFNVLVQFLDTSNQNFSLYQEKLTTRELIEKSRELKRYDFLFKYFYGRYSFNHRRTPSISEDLIKQVNAVSHVMKGIDLYSEFLKTPYRSFFLNLMFQMNPIVPQNIDLTKELALSYLCNIIYLKYHDEKRIEDEASYKFHHTDEQSKSEDELIDKYIQTCYNTIRNINSHEKAFQLIALTVLIMAEENIVEADQAQFKEMIFYDDQIDMDLKGASCLILHPDDMREEYLLKCVRQYRKFLFVRNNENFHQKVLDLLDKRCRSVINVLEKRRSSRKPSEIIIQEHKEREFQEIDTERDSPSFTAKMSTRDVIQSFVMDFSRRFLKKDEDKDKKDQDEDDTFNL